MHTTDHRNNASKIYNFCYNLKSSWEFQLYHYYYGKLILKDNALNDYKQRQSQISNKGKVDLLDKHCFVFANDDGTFRTYSGTQKIFATNFRYILEQ